MKGSAKLKVLAGVEKSLAKYDIPLKVMPLPRHARTGARWLRRPPEACLVGTTVILTLALPTRQNAKVEIQETKAEDQFAIKTSHGDEFVFKLDTYSNIKRAQWIDLLTAVAAGDEDEVILSDKWNQVDPEEPEWKKTVIRAYNGVHPEEWSSMFGAGSSSSRTLDQMKQAAKKMKKTIDDSKKAGIGSDSADVKKMLERLEEMNKKILVTERVVEVKNTKVDAQSSMSSMKKALDGMNHAFTEASVAGIQDVPETKALRDRMKQIEKMVDAKSALEKTTDDLDKSPEPGRKPGMMARLSIAHREAPIAKPAERTKATIAHELQAKTELYDEKHDEVLQKTEQHPTLRRRPSNYVKPSKGPTALQSNATKNEKSIEKLNLEMDHLEEEIKVSEPFHDNHARVPPQTQPPYHTKSRFILPQDLEKELQSYKYQHPTETATDFFATISACFSAPPLDEGSDIVRKNSDDGEGHHMDSSEVKCGCGPDMISGMMGPDLDETRSAREANDLDGESRSACVTVTSAQQ
jgi:hypothetical protein